MKSHIKSKKGRLYPISIFSRGYKGYKQISGAIYASIKSQAKTRQIPFNLSIEYLGDLLESQDYKCKITQVPINLPLSSKHPECEKTASLDRIDNSKGYIEGNVQWVHKAVNRIRHTNTLEQLYTYCAAIYHTTINTPKEEENA